MPLEPLFKATPGEALPPISRNGYRVHPAVEHGGQIRLILKSFDGRTKPAIWHVTVTTPRFAGQPFWFKRGEETTEDSGSIQIRFPRQFDTPIGVPLPQSDYSVRWLTGLVDHRSWKTVDADELAVVRFRIDEEGTICLIWWGEGDPDA